LREIGQALLCDIIRLPVCKTVRSELAIAKKILVVEDDPSFQRYLDFLFNKEGYQVILASNGLEGLRKARQESPDLLILDVMLPGLDGFEVCHRLREEPTTAKLPILMLSAKGQDADKISAERVGANIFLVKPVDRKILLDTVTQLLGGQPGGPSEKAGV
jgi:DNA-binding response OmpR family regulator